MVSNAAGSNTTGTWPEVRTGPLVLGGTLVGIGVAVALAGLAIAGLHLAAATRQWIRELEIPPSQLARLKWEQAKTAAASGATSWREHPNAKTGLSRRGTVS